MTEQELRQVLQQGHETPGVEFKGAGLRTDRQLFAKVARAALAMANRRGGGSIVVGVREETVGLCHDGVTDIQLATWSHDALTGALNAYADPHVELSIEIVVLDSTKFLVVQVAEFEETPVLCKRDFEGVLRAGACYVRRRGRIESSELPNHAEMRNLLELATEKAVRRFLRTATRAGLQIDDIASAQDTSPYSSELETFE